MADPKFDRDREERLASDKILRFLNASRADWEKRLREKQWDVQQVGKRFLKEREDELLVLLLLIWRKPIELSLRLELGKLEATISRRGLDFELLQERARSAAVADAERRAGRAARDIVGGTYTRLRSNRELILSDPDARGGLIRDTLGRTRADGIAITQTTANKSAGLRSTRDVLLAEKVKLRTYWRTERDGKVCPICRPLDGKLERVWSYWFPEGPPAHPRCRCDLEIVPV